MRAILRKGAQKKLLASYKTDNKLTWPDFAKVLSVSPAALKDWFYERNSLPLEIFSKLDSGNKGQSLMEIKEDSWGRILGGLKSPGSLKQILCPSPNGDLAELVGIILGDGNLGYYKKSKKIGTYAVRIGGHLIEDRTYLEEYVAQLLKNLFGLTPKFVVAKTEFFVVVYSKKLIEFLEESGLKKGDKKLNNVGIPNWILSNPEFAIRCLRGLMDTDGSVFRMSKRDKDLLRLKFTNFSSQLLTDAHGLFDKLGYKPNKMANNAFFISSKSEIRRYLLELGFKNPKHLKRIRQFQNS